MTLTIISSTLNGFGWALMVAGLAMGLLNDSAALITIGIGACMVIIGTLLA